MLTFLTCSFLTYIADVIIIPALLALLRELSEIMNIKPLLSPLVYHVNLVVTLTKVAASLESRYDFLEDSTCDLVIHYEERGEVKG